MNTCYVMVGLPGVGKSTFLKSVAYKDDVFIYSTDNYIEQVAKANNSTYTDMFNATISKAKHVMDQKLKQAIANNFDIYWDQTNISAKKRKMIIDKMRKHNYRVECLSFVRPASHAEKSLWFLRLEQRKDKSIPASVINSMYNSYQAPTLDEGYDKLTEYGMHQNEL